MGTNRFRAVAACVTAVMVVAACGHGDTTTSAAGETTAVPAASVDDSAVAAPADSSLAHDTTQAPVTTEPAQAPGAFGDLQGVCGPAAEGGVAPIEGVRGVDDTSIQIGVLNDATNQFSPGLGKRYLQVGKAFTDWCNAAGGINGRTLEMVNRDAQLTQAGARVTEACQSDFMLVGGATPLDASTVDPRVACGLGAIPAYATSTEAVHAALQALPMRIVGRDANIAVLRLLQDEYGDTFGNMGVVAIDDVSLLEPTELFMAAAATAGATITQFQKVPLVVDNWRTFVEPMRAADLQSLIPGPGDNTAMYQAMLDVGWEPKVLLDPVGSNYAEATLEELRAAPPSAPFFLSTLSYPIELADQNPATRQAIDLTRAADGDAIIDNGLVGAWAAWIAFAVSARACGAELSVECVIAKATAEHEFTAGGLIAPVDLGDVDDVGACRAIVQATVDGFVYREDITKPDYEVFNCDPANLVPVG